MQQRRKSLSISHKHTLTFASVVRSEIRKNRKTWWERKRRTQKEEKKLPMGHDECVFIVVIINTFVTAYLYAFYRVTHHHYIRWHAYVCSACSFSFSPSPSAVQKDQPLVAVDAGKFWMWAEKWIKSRIRYSTVDFSSYFYTRPRSNTIQATFVSVRFFSSSLSLSVCVKYAMPVMMITRICKKEMKDTNLKAERRKNNGRENKRVQVFFCRLWVVTVLLIKKRCACTRAA